MFQPWGVGLSGNLPQTSPMHPAPRASVLLLSQTQVLQVGPQQVLCVPIDHVLFTRGETPLTPSSFQQMLRPALHTWMGSPDRNVSCSSLCGSSLITPGEQALPHPGRCSTESIGSLSGTAVYHGLMRPQVLRPGM